MSARILIVDDERSSRATMRALLLRDGHELDLAASAAEGLECIQKQAPDLILSDVMMPRMNGFDFCRQLKNDESLRHIPVVLVTALNSRDDMIRGLDSGADEFLTKPVSGGELRARVRSMLRIKQQHDELKEAMQLREDLTRILVHDMRNPLAALMVTLDLLEDNPMSAEALEDVHRAQQQTTTLARLLDEMLLAARLENGRIRLKRTPFDLVELVKEVSAAEWLRVSLGKRRLTTHFSVPQMPIEGDRRLLWRALENLLSNAVKFSPDGSEVELLLTPERFEVRDQGPGVPANAREHIFEKFAVVHRSGVEQTGLGLYFCRLVADAHRARIWVEDNEPQGARFVIEFYQREPL